MNDLDERYRNDHAFMQLVDMMEAMMHKADFSPSEMRQAAIYASIKFESGRVRYMYVDVPGLGADLNALHERVNEAAKRREL